MTTNHTYEPLSRYGIEVADDLIWFGYFGMKLLFRKKGDALPTRKSLIQFPCPREIAKQVVGVEKRCTNEEVMQTAFRCGAAIVPEYEWHFVLKPESDDE